MAQYYKFSEFNAKPLKPSEFNNADTEIVLFKKIIGSKSTFPLIFQRLTDSTTFYSENFDNIISKIVREQRYLIFETPNRVNVKHEYTIEGSPEKSGYFYLFNPKERLDWLKIYIEDERVSIAPKQYVLEVTEKVLIGELTDFTSKFPEYTNSQILEFLYYKAPGLPCFIEFNAIPKFTMQKCVFIIVDYYTTPIYERSSSCSFLQIINSRKFDYLYSPLNKNSSAWLYLKSPTNFEIKLLGKSGGVDFPLTDDPEISTAVIKDGNTKEFKYKIKVPMSLSIWFHMLVVASLAFILFLFVYLGDKINLFSQCKPLHKIAILKDRFLAFPEDLFLSMGLAIIAAIIATRGWLIVEETILKKIATINTILMILILVMMPLIYILSS